ncbi:MAG TPA: pyruvate kinase alpha/beta domain-containing protein [Amaricoccus sp.]|nr:pyruvate kinase alpha/beta domain-containing protein [Amaricoccus sp.]
MVALACTTLAERGFAGPGDIVAIAAGMPFGVAGSTNLLRIEQIPTDAEAETAGADARELRAEIAGA